MTETAALPEAAKVFLAVPYYDKIHPKTIASVANAVRPAAAATVVDTHLNSCSLLTSNFNRLWCQALELRQSEGVTHFAMLHADVAPDVGWIDILLDEMRQHEAAVISAVLPLKDSRGLTSTAIGVAGVPDVKRRLTLREIHKLPRTFSAADAGEPGAPLLINTGCWLCDLRGDWVDKFPGFTVVDSIGVDEDGKRHALCFSEDWWFGLWLASNGVKAMATRAVAAAHYGEAAYRNDVPFGLAHDPSDRPKPSPRLHEARQLLAEWEQEPEDQSDYYRVSKTAADSTRAIIAALEEKGCDEFFELTRDINGGVRMSWPSCRLELILWDDGGFRIGLSGSDEDAATTLLRLLRGV